MIEYNVGGAFIVGLMGAAHCFGMCGGLIGAFSTNIPNNGQSRLANQLRFLLSYNLGRITSYTLAGALVGGSASALGQLFDADIYLLCLRIFAGFMMILTGLYIAQIWFGIVHIEKVGKVLWRYLQPLTRKVLPIKHPHQALLAGMVWGWLPCGLVYSTLTWSVASGSALQGALIMLAFGLGTLPALFAAGMAAKTLAQWVQKRAVRLLSGLLLVLFGLQTLYIAFSQLS
ncbi:sulfite exporter TauE/SafE family protein [Shewanella ulleungensis]|uniref:Cytochrome biogenesis protein n=1 Tax=Shewanella ulleungensis TaxID=2282699 RepID=A0ABQ2QCF8_9GAMM|nr:sulfite exporter TauE/SafE family protein [Shewanella ulleungensis]MCL1148817.1 sulfite exporter TauE/SafE family protein [Shewanella ulleungensis]GGP75430.1 cytochrome biogenesis protein [Shewanella ulleungensis]